MFVNIRLGQYIRKNSKIWAIHTLVTLAVASIVGSCGQCGQFVVNAVSWWVNPPIAQTAHTSAHRMWADFFVEKSNITPIEICLYKKIVTIGLTIQNITASSQL